MITTYTCQEDNCGKTGTDMTDFKKIEVRTGFTFAFVVCNEHAKKYGIGERSEPPGYSLLLVR